MSIIISNNLDTKISINYKEIINKVIDESLKFENCNFETQVCVTITDDKEIQQINKQFRNIDKITDVLSFPLIDFIIPSDFSVINGQDDEYFDLDTNELILGDIIISIDTAIRQAEEYGHSLDREIAFLIAHSMLHLLGYDHMIKEEEVIMIEKQKNILNKVGYSR